MPDMLVKLYELPDIAQEMSRLAEVEIVVRHPIAPEKHIVVDWVRDVFGEAWASETEVAFTNQPISCYVAIHQDKVVGFACYDATVRNFFGPTGVDPAYRGKGIGKVLFLASLHAMRESGYAYAIIGGAGPVEFYAKTAGAVVIEGSVPGIYRGMLRRPST